MKQLLFALLCFVTLTPIHAQDTPEPFLEGIVDKFPNVRDIAISPNGNEVIFSAQSVMGDISALVSVTKTKAGWSQPKVMSFSGQFFDLEPFFAPDGLQLYFVSNRPLDNTTTEIKDFDIWVVNRSAVNDTWSAPENLGAPINTSMDEFYPAITNSGNLYFTLDNPELKQRDNIYVSELKNGKYTTPKALSEGINTVSYEFNAFVAPDESYLIFSGYNRKDGLGSGDMYISYNNDGVWSTAKNLTTINSDKMDYCPFVDTKTNTLYFTSKRLGNYNTTNTKRSLEELKTIFKQFDNGLSRLYRVKFEGN
ncbi:hypothetical protein [Winogradskyella sp. 3972H.M.0a.05]|uniref:TolB family protein n=1 Tax=Winogradskyella sp. 3972H.M.0a.05 TaxID=2950277 RepID=UPI003390C180